MLPWKANMKGSHMSNLFCEACRGRGSEEVEVESDSHVMVCPGYSNLRQGLDLSQDGDLVSYIQAVMLAREEGERERRKNK